MGSIKKNNKQVAGLLDVIKEFNDKTWCKFRTDKNLAEYIIEAGYERGSEIDINARKEQEFELQMAHEKFLREREELILDVTNEIYLYLEDFHDNNIPIDMKAVQKAVNHAVREFTGE